MIILTQIRKDVQISNSGEFKSSCIIVKMIFKQKLQIFRKSGCA